MICKHCKSFIWREIGKSRGYTVNLMAYGCERLSTEGKYCDRDEIIRWTLAENNCWNSNTGTEPDREGDYLVHIEIETEGTGEKTYKKAVAKWRSPQKRWFVYRFEQQHLIKVLHWMELPKTPKVDK